MGWFLRERRGPAWKHGWTEQTLASISAPPLPLLAIAGIMLLLLSLNSYTSYRSQMLQTVITFRLFFFLLPVLLIFVMHSITRYGRLIFAPPITKNAVVHRAESVPWGLGLLVVVLVLMVSYQPYFQSMWWPPIWRSY